VGRAIGQSRSVPSGAGDGGDMERAVELGIRSEQLRGGGSDLASWLGGRQ
jgi:hypothetical protein